jgi:hypothetical protein
LALYPWHIIGLASFSAIATLLVVGLLIQRSRHGRAKAALRTSDERERDGMEKKLDEALAFFKIEKS